MMLQRPSGGRIYISPDTSLKIVRMEIHTDKWKDVLTRLHPQHLFYPQRRRRVLAARYRPLAKLDVREGRTVLLSDEAVLTEMAIDKGDPSQHGSATPRPPPARSAAATPRSRPALQEIAPSPEAVVYPAALVAEAYLDCAFCGRPLGRLTHHKDLLRDAARLAREDILADGVPARRRRRARGPAARSLSRLLSTWGGPLRGRPRRGTQAWLGAAHCAAGQRRKRGRHWLARCRAHRCARRAKGSLLGIASRLRGGDRGWAAPMVKPRSRAVEFSRTQILALGSVAWEGSAGKRGRLDLHPIPEFATFAIQRGAHSPEHAAPAAEPGNRTQWRHDARRIARTLLPCSAFRLPPGF